MRSRIFGGWRPVAGVVAVGVLTFAWSLQGATAPTKASLEGELGAKSAQDSVVVVEADSPVFRQDIGDTSAGTELRVRSEIGATGADGALEATRNAATHPRAVQAVVQTLERFQGVARDATVEPIVQDQGGVAGPAACVCDSDCGDGNVCTIDTCVAGMCQQSFAIAGETCVAVGAEEPFCDDLGTCQSLNGVCGDSGLGGPRCAALDTCNEVDNRCEDCPLNDPGVECPALVQADIDACLTQSCTDGRCGLTTLCADGFRCDGAGTCAEVLDGRCCADKDNCALTTLALCPDPDGAGPLTNLDVWAVQAAGNFDCSVSCPKYSRGWNEAAGRFVRITGIEEPDCALFAEVGDDYTTQNGSFLQIESIAFTAGINDQGTGEFRITMYDGTVDPPTVVFITDVDALDPAVDADLLFNFGFGFVAPAPIIPDVGFFTIQPVPGSGTTVQTLFVDNEVGSGDNNPLLAWRNDGPGQILSPDFPDIMRLDIAGSKVAPPEGGCCDGGVCSITTAWNCAGVFLGVGTDCTGDPCGVGACCSIDGMTCSAETDQAACDLAGGAGSSFLPFPASCDPNCCFGVAAGGDLCDSVEVVLQNLTIGSPITYTYNDIALNPTIEDDGGCGFVTGVGAWLTWVGWVLDTPGQPGALVTMDSCCTPQNHAAGQAYFPFLKDGCPCPGPATITSIDNGFGGGGPAACLDGNPSASFQLTPGTYYYMVSSSHSDDNGDITLHFTAESLPVLACCLDSVCNEVTELECTAAGGFFITDNPFCDNPVNPCLLGSCCVPNALGGSDCVGDGLMDQATCEGAPNFGVYQAGQDCINDDPCSICSIESDASCKLPDVTAFDSDYAGDFQVADDHVAGAASVNTMCWWGAYIEGNAGFGGCGPDDVIDNFEICHYQDAGGFPDNATQDCRFVSPLMEGPVGGIWTYNSEIDPAFSEVVGQCYWISITNNTGQPGPNGGACTWLWGTTLPDEGNTTFVFHQSATNDPWIAADQISGDFWDFAYCLSDDQGNSGIGGDVDCGEFLGACCLCEANGCEDNAGVGMTEAECTAAADALGVAGVFYTGQLCGQFTCQPDQTPEDFCTQALTLTHPGNDPNIKAEVDFNTGCQQPVDLYCGIVDDVNMTAVASAPMDSCSIDSADQDACTVATEAVDCPVDGSVCDPINLTCTCPAGETCCPVGESCLVYTVSDDCFPPNTTTINFNASWYIYSLPAAITEASCVQVDTCKSPAGTSFNTSLQVYEDLNDDCDLGDSVGTPINVEDGDIACDSGYGCPGSDPNDPDAVHNLASLMFQATPGMNYKIVAGLMFLPDGRGTVNVTILNPGPCGGDGSEPPLSFSYPPWGDPGCMNDGECQNTSTCIPQPDGTFPGTCYVAKQRALSVAPNPANAGTPQARRVSVLSSAGGPGCDGTRCVLGFFDTPATAYPTGLLVSRISATPVLIDWSTLGDTVAFPGGEPVHLVDCVVQPQRVYEIQSSIDGVGFGSPITLPASTVFGDVAGSVAGGIVSPGQGVASLTDAARIVRGFQGTNTEPFIWLEISSANNPNLIVNLLDASAAVRSFQGGTFQDEAGAVSPCSCPSAGGAAACP